ncbi:MAG TPA: YggT family protein [Leptolinea sp.]
MGTILVVSIAYFFRVLSFVVIVDVLLSYFMNPYHPVRAFLDRIVEPLLNPIRRVMPTIAGLDFSPLVLIVILQILDSVLISLVTGL